jgi:hypothetical protein
LPNEFKIFGLLHIRRLKSLDILSAFYLAWKLKKGCLKFINPQNKCQYSC